MDTATDSAAPGSSGTGIAPPPPPESAAAEPATAVAEPAPAVAEPAPVVAKANSPVGGHSGQLMMKAQQSMPGKMQEERAAERLRMQLRAVLITEKNGVQKKSHGKTIDISSTGVSVVIANNLCVPQTGTVFIMADQGDETHPAVIIEAQCRLIVSVLSSGQGGFRLSLAFTKLLRDGPDILKKLLKDKR